MSLEYVHYMIHVNCRSIFGVLTAMMNPYGLVDDKDFIGYARATRRHLFKLCITVYSLL